MTVLYFRSGNKQDGSAFFIVEHNFFFFRLTDYKLKTPTHETNAFFVWQSGCTGYFHQLLRGNQKGLPGS